MAFFYQRITALAALSAALLPLAAVAQQSASPLNAADAQAAVPPSTYQSVFQQYRPVSEESQSPYNVWIAANQALNGNDAHVMHGMQQQHQQNAMPPHHMPAADHADMHDHHAMEHQ